MKISKLFHWLYALLMFLPLVNVFAYTLRYGFNYGNEIPSVSQNVQQTVDFNQQIGILNSDNNGTLTYTSETYTYTYDYSNTGEFYCRSVFSDNIINWVYGNKYYITVVSSDEFTFRTASSNLWFPINDNGSPTEFIYDCLYNEDSYLFFGKYSANVGDSFSFQYLQVFNLTQMFGEGNEPTIQEFRTWFSDPYYDYTLSEYVVIPNYSSVSVSDDVTNHFWLPQFGLVGHTINDVIGYLLSNVFGLVVSEGIGYIVCGLFTYWLIISLSWLVFDLLMYVPLLVHRWLDKASIS